MQLPFQVYRVSEIAARIRQLLEGDEELSDVTVQGEISNLSKPPSGHIYFTLKDAGAALRCVMWKGAAAKLARPPRDGEAAYVRGHFSFYDQRGDLQLYADELFLLGAGLLYQQFEALKEKLAAEGLFDEARKRALPKYPRVIGLVTSREGAVLHDILHVLRQRYPYVTVYLAPTRVQGDSAPAEIVAALDRIQRVPDLDLVILARGGGSLEDLWAFNDERVARAIVACRVPLISGVGHETDFTIADFVADVRAPTPTAAAQICTPDQRELRANVALARQRLARAMREALAAGHSHLIHTTRALARNSPASHIAQSRQQVDDLTRALNRLLVRWLAFRREQLSGRARHLAALDPAATLARGYAIVSKRDGVIVKRVRQVKRGEALNVRVSDGEFGTQVTGKE